VIGDLFWAALERVVSGEREAVKAEKNPVRPGRTGLLVRLHADAVYLSIQRSEKSVDSGRTGSSAFGSQAYDGSAPARFVLSSCFGSAPACFVWPYHLGLGTVGR
jgi:hypothetical protein